MKFFGEELNSRKTFQILFSNLVGACLCACMYVWINGWMYVDCDGCDICVLPNGTAVRLCMSTSVCMSVVYCWCSSIFHPRSIKLFWAITHRMRTARFEFTVSVVLQKLLCIYKGYGVRTVCINHSTVGLLFDAVHLCGSFLFDRLFLFAFKIFPDACASSIISRINVAACEYVLLFFIIIILFWQFRWMERGLQKYVHLRWYNFIAFARIQPHTLSAILFHMDFTFIRIEGCFCSLLVFFLFFLEVRTIQLLLSFWFYSHN